MRRTCERGGVFLDPIVKVSIVLAALAVIAMAVCGVWALLSLRKTVERMRTSLDSVEERLNRLMQESVQLVQSANQLTHTANRLAEDLHGKVRAVDGLFQSASRVGEAVQEVTTSVKQVSSALSNTVVGSVRKAVDENNRKFSDVMQWVTLTLELYRRWQQHRQRHRHGGYSSPSDHSNS